MEKKKNYYYLELTIMLPSFPIVFYKLFEVIGSILEATCEYIFAHPNDGFEESYSECEHKS